MPQTSIFDGALAKLNSRTVVAGTSAEALSKQLYAAADVLYSVRGSVRAVTTDGLNDAKEGYAFRLGPIPEGNSVALGLVTELRRTAQDWDAALGKVADDMEWLGKMLGKFPKTAAVKMINFRTRSLGEGVTTESFVGALEECSKILLGNMKETKAVLKIVAAEIRDPMGLFQNDNVIVGAKELLERQGAWETRTKSLAEGCKALAAALKTKIASKRDLYSEALAKLASMDDAKRSRFEEGKPADPTENMSPEDAKKWREENEKNWDNFKSAAKADVDLLTDIKTALKEKDSNALQSSLKSVSALVAVQHVIEALITTATKPTAVRDLLGGRLSLKAAAKADVDLLTDIRTALKEKDSNALQATLKGVPALRAVQHVIEALITTATKPVTVRDLLGGRLSLKTAAKADVDLLTDIKTALKEKDSNALQATLKSVPALRAVQHVLEALITTATKPTVVRDLLGGRLSLKASIFDEALLKLSAKKPTFAEVRTVIFEKLKKEGWKLQEGLKIPHATSPDGKTRLWFKAQAVYGNATGTDPRQFKNTQSWTSDLREYADPEAFMRMVERWRSKD